MTSLSVTFIDVGWGDSILVEHIDHAGVRRFGLIDCNDSDESLSSYTFVKQNFELIQLDYRNQRPVFDFVLLTHWHSDHFNGLKRMMRTFGTRQFWYPKYDEGTGHPALIRYARRSSNVRDHQAVNQGKDLGTFGDVAVTCHWPPYTDEGPHSRTNENNNSVVLELRLGAVRFVLTGDCEASRWSEITPRLDRDAVEVFQAPHHGARNGMFHRGQTPWLDYVRRDTRIALSSHIEPHGHPHETVVGELGRRRRPTFRTDQHYHVTFETGGRTVRQKWARF